MKHCNFICLASAPLLRPLHLSCPFSSPQPCHSTPELWDNLLLWRQTWLWRSHRRLFMFIWSLCMLCLCVKLDFCIHLLSLVYVWTQTAYFNNVICLSTLILSVSTCVLQTSTVDVLSCAHACMYVLHYGLVLLVRTAVSLCRIMIQHLTAAIRPLISMQV